MYIVNNESIRLCLKTVTDKHELTILQIAKSHTPNLIMSHERIYFRYFSFLLAVPLSTILSYSHSFTTREFLP